MVTLTSFRPKKKEGKNKIYSYIIVAILLTGN